MAVGGHIEDYLRSETSGLTLTIKLTPKKIMAKVQKKSGTSKRSELKVVNFHAAGIDISPKEMQVCVPLDSCEENNRTFGVYTKDLHAIADWLKDCGVTTVAMESTSVYWLPIFGVLKDAGFEVLLVDPRQAKNYSGKKTDESDAEWLRMLHSYGLLKSCYQPDNIIRQIRNLTRHRDNLIRSSSREVLHLQKEMEQMNLKLDNVFSDILGKSGQAIITAILNGERDPEKLANLADRRCKKSHEEIVASLQAKYDEGHLFVMRQSQDLYLYYQKQIADCERKIEELLRMCTAKVDNAKVEELTRSNKQKGYHNDISFDVEQYAYHLWGVNAMRLPGLNKSAILRLASELGDDFVDKFEDARHFTSWANLVPNNKISGGKLLSSRVPNRKNPVGQIFRQCANALCRSKDIFGDYFRSMRARKGHLGAMIATGHKLATIFFKMVQDKKEFDETLYAEHRKYALDKQIERTQNKLLRLQKERMSAS